MDYFNFSSELAKAKEPAFKSGMLRRYAKGGFTNRSEYKRSIENDIRVGMYAEGGIENPVPTPPVKPIYDIYHTNAAELMYGNTFTPVEVAKQALEQRKVFYGGMAPVNPSTGKLNLQNAPQVGKYNTVRDAQGNIIQPSLPVMADGGPIRPIYTSNPNDPRLQRYNDSLFAYNQGNADVTNMRLSLSRTADAHNKNKYFWENPYSPIYKEVRLTNSEREKEQGIRGLMPETVVVGATVPRNDTYIDNLINNYASPTRGGKDASFAFRYRQPVQPIIYSPNNNIVNTLASKPKPTTKPKPPFVPDPKVVAKQKQLKEAGLYSGELDGIWGPKSEEAWKKYEEASKPKPAPVVNKPTTTSAPRGEVIKDERYYLPRNQAPRLPSGVMNPQIYRGSGNTPGIEVDASGNPIMAKGGLKKYAKGALTTDPPKTSLSAYDPLFMPPKPKLWNEPAPVSPEQKMRQAIAGEVNRRTATTESTRTQPKLVSQEQKQYAKENNEESLRQKRLADAAAAEKEEMTLGNWPELLARRSQATADKLDIPFIPNVIDPAYMLGSMASGLGAVPYNVEQGNYGQAALGVLAPVATGALGSLGARTTGQFLNNVVNPVSNASTFGQIKEGLTNLDYLIDESLGYLLKNRSNKKAIAEGNEWLKNWIQHPTTQNKIDKDFADKLSTGFRKNSFDLGYEQAKNFVPVSKELPLSVQLATDFYPNKGNLGVSYLHNVDPATRNLYLDPSYTPTWYGSFISRSINSPYKKRVGTTIHEGTHDWASDFGLKSSGQYNFLERNINPKIAEDLKYWKTHGNEKTTKDLGRKRSYLAYLADPTEQHARIMELRKYLGHTPDFVATPEYAQKVINRINNLPIKNQPIDKNFFKVIDNDPQKLSDMFNRLWGAAPLGIVGASATQEYEKGGLKSYAKGGLIKRADGSYSRRGLWDNIRANRGSGKKPTKQMLEQEKKIKAKTKYEDGGSVSPNLQLFGKGGYRVSRTNERKGKTHKVTGPDGTVKYFGDPSMGERSKSKYGKDAFYKRHAKSLKKNPHFRAYAKATWSDGGLVSESDLFNLSSY